MSGCSSVHSRAPWTDVTFFGVYYNEAKRLPKLLRYVRPWFKYIVVGVQQSSDKTFEIASRYADVVVEDKHWGYAEPTWNKVIEACTTPYGFCISGDEWPSEDLLDGFQAIVDEMLFRGHDSASFHFVSSIDGLDFTAETDRHVRLFKLPTYWPMTMHSGPMVSNPLVWPDGHIRHDRSLDEMMRDYLVYYEKGIREEGWRNHNTMMMREACKGVAQTKGWEYIQSFRWWPQVEAIAFTEEQPWVLSR